MLKLFKLSLIAAFISMPSYAVDNEKNERLTEVFVNFPTQIRISANYKVDLSQYPGEFHVVDLMLAKDIGHIAKDRVGTNRVSIHEAYPLTEAHFRQRAIKLGIRYDVDDRSEETVPVHFYKNEYKDDMDLEICPLESKLEAIRLDLMENLVIGPAPIRASGYCRYGQNTEPLLQYVGLSLAEPNSLCNDEKVYKKILETCGYSVPAQHPNSDAYINEAEEMDFHKGQLLIINSYLAEAQEKYHTAFDRYNATQCNLLLNLFIYKGVVQTNERQKFADELDLRIN